MNKIKDLIEPLSNKSNGYTAKVNRFFDENNFSEEEKIKVRHFFHGDKNILNFIDFLKKYKVKNSELKKDILLYINSNNLLKNKEISYQTLKEIEEYFGGDMEKTIDFLDFIETKVGINKKDINYSITYILNNFGFYINKTLEEKGPE